MWWSRSLAQWTPELILGSTAVPALQVGGPQLVLSCRMLVCFSRARWFEVQLTACFDQ